MVNLGVKKQYTITTVVSNCEGISGKIPQSKYVILHFFQKSSLLKRVSSMKKLFRRCIFRPPPLKRPKKRRWKSADRLQERYFCRTFIEIWHSLWLNLYDEIQVKSKDLLIGEIYYTPTNSKLVVLQELTLSILKIIFKYQGAKLFLADFILPNIDWDK